MTAPLGPDINPEMFGDVAKKLFGADAMQPRGAGKPGTAAKPGSAPKPESMAKPGPAPTKGGNSKGTAKKTAGRR